MASNSENTRILCECLLTNNGQALSTTDKIEHYDPYKLVLFTSKVPTAVVFHAKKKGDGADRRFALR